MTGDKLLGGGAGVKPAFEESEYLVDAAMYGFGKGKRGGC